jgi:hypothetical protein
LIKSTHSLPQQAFSPQSEAQLQAVMSGTAGSDVGAPEWLMHLPWQQY